MRILFFILIISNKCYNELGGFMQYLFFIAILPVILLLFFIYKKDYKKERKRSLLSSFMLGVVISIPIVIVEIVLEIFLSKNHIMDIFIGVDLIEEGFKWLIVKSKYKKDEFDETYDGIVYAVFVSLGFAAIENILYVCTSSLSTGILRAITAVPGHAFYAVIMGYYMGKAKQYSIDKNKSKENKLLFISLLIPTILHGIYDVLLVDNILAILVWMVFVILVTTYSILLVFKASKNNMVYNKKKYCIMCGTYVENMNYCINCGHKNE